MKLRYRNASSFYVPQYFNNEKEEWFDFKVKDLSKYLEAMAIAIASVDNAGRWDIRWHFIPDKKSGQKTEDMSLLFKTEIAVSAFLGAAKSTYNREPINFEL